MEAPNEFYERFRGIGIELMGSDPDYSADIERTLIEASEYAEPANRRILGLLASWVVVHGGLVNVTRFKRLLEQEKKGDRQLISALAYLAVANGFHTWKPLCKKFPERAFWGSSSLSALKFKKPQKDFGRAGLLLPADYLRIRERDILTIEELAPRHRLVHHRLLFGVNPRADVAFYLEKSAEKKLTLQELMTAVGCSYEPVHRIVKSFDLAGITQSLRQQRI